MTVWIAFGVAGLLTFLTRTSFIALGDRITLPQPIERALKYVGPAAFAAISIPIVLDGNDISGDAVVTAIDLVPRVVAAAAAVAFIRWRNSIAVSLVVGMGTLWVLSALL